MNPGEDKKAQDGKSMKLNLNATEYKPKFGSSSQTTQPTQNTQNMNYQNPYGFGNNMYNPYGGMYMNNNMMYGQNYMGYGDSGAMGTMNPYGGGMMDPNMMYGMNQMNQSNQININPETKMSGNPQETGNVNQPKPSGGLVGMGGKGKKAGNVQAGSGQSGTGTTTGTNPQQAKTVITKKPQDAKKDTGAKSTTSQKKPQTTTTTTNTTNKPEEKKEKEIQSKPNQTQSTDVNEITTGVSNMGIEATDIPLETDAKEGAMIEVDTDRNPVTIVFIGHVDSGKSTISGSILYKTGQVDERSIEKYKREAKVNNRESWYMAYIMDINKEEQEKGKTVEVGKAFFETPTKRFTIMDAPGHASFVPNMLQGACVADYAGLVISAKTGEFEAGFEKDGRTREHALLAKSLGVHKLVVLVNKMDEESVKWSKERFDKIKEDLSGYLKLCGYNLEKQVYWIPMSGLTGENLAEPVSKHKCPWYEGPTLLELLDQLENPPRNDTGPVRVPILDRYKDQGVYVIGKLESGTVKYGSTLTAMPGKINFDVIWLFDSEERGVPYAKPGEIIRMKIRGIENEAEIMRGGVICSPDDICPVFNTFETEIMVIELPETKPIMANGYQCILHMHTIIEECTIEIVAEIDRKTKTEKKVKFIRSQTRAKVFIKVNNPICGEKFEKFPNLGRFTLRDEGKTIAIGKILRYKPLK